ncbi:MAG: phage terminase large subunit [Candidatus Omnitrophica bacterium]|nr:phage terminase large subunit [Candidatus Omnitrophota bacterium]
MKRDILTDLSKLRRAESAKSLLAFSRLYMKHHMQYEPSEAHLEIYRLLDEAMVKRGQKIAIAAPRFFGKSTLITLIHVLRLICHSPGAYIVIISNTASQATQMLDNIKKELMENELIRMDFPEVFESKGISKCLRWRESDIITRNGVKIMALGTGQQIRGRRFGTTRPTDVIADDMEDSENTFSLDLLDKRRDWYDKSVLRVGAENTNHTFLGNLYHPHSLLAEFVSKEDNPSWTKRIYSTIITWPKNMDLWEVWSAIYRGRNEFQGSSGPKAAAVYYEQNKARMDEEAKLLWASRYKLYDIMSMWADNELSFMSEMQNMPRNPADCLLNVDSIVYYDQDGRSTEDLLRLLEGSVKFYLACDPSLGLDSVKADPSAIVVVAKDEKTGRLYIVDADIKRRPPEEIVDAILAYQIKYKITKIGIEANQYQRVLIDMVKKKGEEARIYPNIEAIINKDNKISRIQTLRPRILSGMLQFSKRHRQLLEEARYFPKGRHDDGLDALEMAVRLSDGNDFDFWVGAGPGDRPKPDSPIYPTPEGLVPYGWYGWHRRDY